MNNRTSECFQMMNTFLTCSIAADNQGTGIQCLKSWHLFAAVQFPTAIDIFKILQYKNVSKLGNSVFDKRTVFPSSTDFSIY